MPCNVKRDEGVGDGVMVGWASGEDERRASE